MKYAFFIMILFGMSDRIFPQHSYSESTFWNEKMTHQYTFLFAGKHSKITYFNLTSLSTDYNNGIITESYLIDNFVFFDIKKEVSIASEFALNQERFSIAFGARYRYIKNNFRFNFFPTFRISEKSSILLRMLVEYRISISESVDFYFRGQLNTLIDFYGNKDLNNLYRVGFQYKNIRLGLGTPWFKALSMSSINMELVGLFIGISF